MYNMENHVYLKAIFNKNHMIKDIGLKLKIISMTL